MAELHVVIPFIGQAKYTLAALRTLKTSYTYVIHLLDNNSKDNSEDIIKTFYPNIDYNRVNFSRSVSESWNQGIAISLRDPECKYILIVNNDVLFHPKTIDNLINFKEKSNYIMVTARNVNDGSLQDSDLFKLEPKDFDEEDLKPITNWREEGPDFSCFLIDSDFRRKFGLFDENFFPAYFEDNDTHTRIIKMGEHAKRVSTAPYFHYGSRTSQGSEEVKDLVNKTFDLNKKYFIKKWGAMPSDVLDGQGYNTPYNSDKSINYWRGIEKYL